MIERNEYGYPTIAIVPDESAISRESYWECFNELVKNSHLRYGQAMFIALETLSPYLANQVRGQSFDPFYHNKDSSVVQDFCTWLEKEFARG